MKRGVAILAGLLIITIAGSVITADLGFSIPVIRQTSDPMASYFAAPPGQANAFILLILFVVGSLLVNGLIATGLIWFFNREVKIVAQRPTRSDREAAEETESLPEKATA